jgi:hypothetical protein
MALKKQSTPKRWRSKQAKEIVAAVERAGGQVERTASGHLKVIGPTGGTAGNNDRWFALAATATNSASGEARPWWPPASLASARRAKDLR